MSSGKTQTEMVAPVGAATNEIQALRDELTKAKAENEALRMFAPPQARAYEAKVKAKVNTPILLSNGAAHKPGDEVLMSESDAHEFCDRSFTMPYDFSGERTGEAPKPTMRRAVRVA